MCCLFLQGIFTFSSLGTTLRSTQPPIQLVSVAPAPGKKRSEPKADYSPPTNSKDKKTYIYSSTPAYTFTA